MNLYRKCLEGFLRDWRKGRGLPPMSEERIANKLTLLEDVALELWEAGHDYVSTRQLTGTLQKHELYSSLVVHTSQGSLIHELSEEDGILVKAGIDVADVPYMFLHLTFQEYLAACALARRTDWQKTVERWLYGAWERRIQVLLFLAGILEDPGPLVELLLQHDDARPGIIAFVGWRPARGKDPFGNLLVLAAYCSKEAKTVRTDLATGILKRIRKRGISEFSKEKKLEALAWLAWYSDEAKAFVKTWDLSRNDKMLAALGQIKPPGSLEILLSALRDGDSRIRRSAAEALGALGDRQAVPALLSALHDEDGWTRITAAEALGLGADPSLVRGLRELNKRIRRSAAEALGALGDRQAVPALLSALRDEDGGGGITAAQALGAIGDRQAVPALLGALRMERIHSLLRMIYKQLYERIPFLDFPRPDLEFVVIAIFGALERIDRRLREEREARGVDYVEATPQLPKQGAFFQRLRDWIHSVF